MYKGVSGCLTVYLFFDFESQDLFNIISVLPIALARNRRVCVYSMSNKMILMQNTMLDG